MNQGTPKGWLYTLRGMESYSPTRLPHCTALGWHEIPLYDGAATAQSHLQSRGRHYDIIREAIAAYDDYMLDDDYDAQRTLDSIIKKMRERVDMADAPAASSSLTSNKLGPPHD